jgi:RNA polymerase sigma-70 factor (ECF subfamily)
MPTEADIREALASGDAQALAWLWDRYGQELFALLLGLLASRPDAEDVLQDVFAKFARDSRTLARVRHLRGYLYRMARNAAVDRLRSRSRSQHLEPGDLPWLWPGETETPSTEEVRRLSMALAALPSEQRAVLVLKVFRDMTFGEVGEALGVSPNTAASRYRYALDKLRKMLREHDV